MSASTTAYAMTAPSAATTYSLAPLWRDVRAELRARRQDRRTLVSVAQRHLYLVASDGELVTHDPAA